MTTSRKHSLRWRVSALISLLIAAVLATVLVIVYSAVERVLLGVGRERAVAATNELATLLALGARQRVADLKREANNPVFVTAVTSPSDETLAAAESRLHLLTTAGQQVLELWGDDGKRRVFVASPAGAESVLTTAVAPTHEGLRLLETPAHLVVSESIEPVNLPGGRTGFLLVRKPVTVTTNAEVISRLMGSGARILLGGSDGGSWTDLTHLVAAPPTSQRGAAFDTQSAAGEARIGAVAVVPGTPWLVSVDFPRAASLRPLWPFLEEISAVGLGFIVIAIVVGRVATGRVIRPLEDLTKASEAIAGGDYSARVSESRPGELGRLGASFNTMAGELDAGRQRLEAQVQERTEALEALRYSESRHRAVVSVAFDSIITIDLAGRITEFNPAAERTFGYARADVMGHELADLIVPPQHRDAHRTGLARYAATGEGSMIGRLLELTALRADGTEFPVEFAIQAVHIDDQTSFTAYIRDLTERRRTDELRLRSLSLEAENRQVREANRLKSEFLANMSHELRTPLNAIIGFSTILRDAPPDMDPAQRTEFLGDILTSGKHLLQLINDVLDLSKVEAGKLEFRPQPLEVDRVVREVLSVLKEVAAARSITLDTDLAPLPDLSLDAGRLKQVLYNYISNALKFTPVRGHVTVRAREDGPDAWRLEVEDTGIGIAQADLPRLFTEFEQLDAGASKQHGGTGLGLALTKRLVEAQGGQVGVTSTPGAGSVFWARLPRVQGTASPAPKSEPAARGGGPAILVIEDDPADRAELVSALGSAGFDVEAVATGHAAVARCRERAFAAVTLDLLLPDESGLEVLKQIRKQGRNPAPRVVVVTVVAERHALAGHLVEDILPKPVDVESLLASLRRAGVVPGTGRIVVVDDDPAALKIAQAVLSSEHVDVELHDNPFAALASVTKNPPRAIVLDLLMPEMDGLAFLDQLRQVDHGRTPVIVWTAKDLSTAERTRLADAARAIVQKGPAGAGLVAELRIALAVAGDAA